MANKEDIRKIVREGRGKLTDEERKIASQAIVAKLKRFCDDDVVAVYFASPKEIDLGEFIAERLRRRKVVVSPRWNGEGYDLAVIESLERLRRGPMGIMEPENAQLIHPSNVTTWFVPGLAFTQTGKRIGYGGGWYDRLLASASEKSQKIGISYNFQIFPNLPTEEHDVSLNEVIFP